MKTEIDKKKQKIREVFKDNINEVIDDFIMDIIEEVSGIREKEYFRKVKELERVNYKYGQLSNKYAKSKYDYDILLKRFNNLKEKEKC